MVTKFQNKVYLLCKKIPRGKVSTYREIGNSLGGKGQIYRAVGVALNKNPLAPEVPCHRVVNSNGFVGGFAHGKMKKIKLLRKEGVEIIDDKVDFSRYLYRLTSIKKRYFLVEELKQKQADDKLRKKGEKFV